MKIVYYQTLFPVSLLKVDFMMGLKSNVLLPWLIVYVLWTGVMHDIELSTLVEPSTLSMKDIVMTAFPDVSFPTSISMLIFVLPINVES